jgi:hypothetical protein
VSKFETYLALLAVVLASLSVVSIGGKTRPVLALVAIALLALIGYLRLRRQIAQPKTKSPTLSAYERAMRIQEERDRKYHGR